MSLGITGLRQHVVEFIRGVGVKTDGVLDSSDTTSPFSWTVPPGVVTLVLDGCAAGNGGGGGGSLNTYMAGGGGGPAGPSFRDVKVSAIPGTALTITIPAGGTAGSIEGWGQPPTEGLKVEGLLPNTPNAVNTTFFVRGQTGATPFGLGNASTVQLGATGNHGEGGTGSAGGGATAGANGGNNVSPAIYSIFGGAWWFMGSAGGGASGASPTAVGGNGGNTRQGNTLFEILTSDSMSVTVGGTGGTNGTTRSGGGGGAGGSSLFGGGGNGGGNATLTNQNGSPGNGYGAGGGGGGGGGTGGAGADGYLRITYWSMD